MDFWSQVWKRVWEMAFFDLKLGLDLEMRAAQPHQKFQGVPPPPGGFNHFIDILPTNAFREFDWNGQGQILASIGVCLFARKFYDICNLRLLVQFLGCIGIMTFSSSWFISLHPSMEKPDRNYSRSYHCFWRKKVDTNSLALLFSWSTIKWQMIR